MRQALQNVSNQLSSTGYAWSIFNWKSFLIPLVKKASDCSFSSSLIWWFEYVTSGRKEEGKKMFGSYSDEMIVKITFFSVSLLNVYVFFLYHFEFCVFRFLLLWLLVAVLLFVAMNFQRCNKNKSNKIFQNQSTSIIKKKRMENKDSFFLGVYSVECTTFILKFLFCKLLSLIPFQRPPIRFAYSNSNSWTNSLDFMTY